MCCSRGVYKVNYWDIIKIKDNLGGGICYACVSGPGLNSSLEAKNPGIFHGSATTFYYYTKFSTFAFHFSFTGDASSLESCIQSFHCWLIGCMILNKIIYWYFQDQQILLLRMRTWFLTTSSFNILFLHLTFNNNLIVYKFIKICNFRVEGFKVSPWFK